MKIEIKYNNHQVVFECEKFSEQMIINVDHKNIENSEKFFKKLLLFCEFCKIEDRIEFSTDLEQFVETNNLRDKIGSEVIEYINDMLKIINERSKNTKLEPQDKFS